MGVAVPSMDQYFLKDGVYHLKSKVSTHIRNLIGAVIVVVSLFSYNEIDAQQDMFSFGYFRDKFTEFITKSNPKVSKKEASTIVLSAYRWAEHFSIDPKLILAIAKVESTYNKFAISNAGAMGLMQVMVKVHTDKIVMAKDVVGTPEPFDIEANMFMGTKILKDCLNRFETKALHCYNGNMMSDDYHNKVMNEYHKLQRI